MLSTRSERILRAESASVDRRSASATDHLRDGHRDGYQSENGSESDYRRSCLRDRDGSLEGSLLEAKTGRYANANFADYLIPTNADVPIINVSFIDKPDTIFNPIGARGIGEIGITGTPSAIANAVYNATGRRVREFPIRPEKLVPMGNRPMISSR